MAWSPPPPNSGPGWCADPAGRAEYRWWNGSAWTEHVATAGHQSLDQDPPVPAPNSVAQGVGRSDQQTAAGGPAAPSGVKPAAAHTERHLFGSRDQARELASEVETLRAQVERLGRLDVLSVAELEERREALNREVAEQQAQLERERETAMAALNKQVAEATWQRDELAAQAARLRSTIVTTEEYQVLQEVGIHEYRHPLSDVVAYQAELKRLQDAIKTMARGDGGAMLANTDWTVNGSRREGRTMVRDYSKLVLRAYNAEADNLVRGMKPYKLSSAIDRLTKVANTIANLGRTMNIRVSDGYHQLRVKELELTADYLEAQAEQKERDREERERLREERLAQKELERERARLEKERQHHQNALEVLNEKGDEDGAGRLRERLAEIDHAIDDVDYRAANIRAGYVYVISNIGSFGEGILKIGLTRRLDPLDRVHELGGASVPFNFDVHALFFPRMRSESKPPCMLSWLTARSTWRDRDASSSMPPRSRSSSSLPNWRASCSNSKKPPMQLSSARAASPARLGWPIRAADLGGQLTRRGWRRAVRLPRRRRRASRTAGREPLHGHLSCCRGPG